jgi:DNA-binding transcriptional ArsR family regulator
MLAFEFDHSDLTNTRFAISPLLELWQSVRALQNPATQSLHHPWASSVREQLDDLDVSLLLTLQPPRGCAPDFIHPPPTTPVSEFEDELAKVLATSPDRVRLEIAETSRPGLTPECLRPFIDDPDMALAQLADLLRAYWRRVLKPHWARIRAALEGDVLYRARQHADGGARRMFAEIDPTVRFVAPRLLVESGWDRCIRLDGRGLLFVPSVFIWPRVAVIDREPWQPTVIYAARGAAELWHPTPPAPDALAALIGPRRATILAALDAPCTTKDLACRLGVLPGNVSQHLSVLRDAGLVTRTRVGRVVLYGRSITGESLITDDVSASRARTKVESLR